MQKPRSAPSPARSLFGAIVLLLPLASYPQDVIINELHYDPPDNTRAEEFVELYNRSGAQVDLSGWFFATGITFVFPQGASIGPESYLVVAEDPAAFSTQFGFAPDHGPYEGRLSNEGDRLALRDERGELVDEVEYQVGFPWPVAAAGGASSMELIHPSLDNDLGGSWRASGYSTAPPVPPTYYIPPQSPAWRYRKGTSEASTPREAWRLASFVEDAGWLTGRTSIGYGDGDDNTILADMLNGYSSVYLRHEFFVDDPDAIPDGWKLRVYADDGAIVWLNGVEVARLYVPAGDIPYNGAGVNHEAAWEEVDLPDPESILIAGENLLAIHAFNTTLASSDFSIDATLLVPGTEEGAFAESSPGAPNTILSQDAPPQIRQVNHLPAEPPSGRTVVLTAKVTDPDGVSEVKVRYQVVPPGNYIPAFFSHPQNVLLGDPTRPHEPNPAFEDPANWSEIVMRDDGLGQDEQVGDAIYTALLPAQGNRTLVRYRLVATDGGGISVTVPYADDRSLNFAYFVYDGVPPYVAGTLTVQPGGVPYTYSSDLMRSLPVYFLITLASDMTHCIAYDGSFQIPKENEAARDEFNWEGAFVYDGVVYDHIRYRLRQANDRYGGSGKRSMRFRFNKGRHFRARDAFGKEYPIPWRTLNTGKMFDNKGVGNFGLTETMNSILWNLVGVPAPYVHTFHFRVIDGAGEAPAGANGQYFGDFWGMHLAFEDYDSDFLDTHRLEDGNLYKLKDQIFDGNRVKRHQGRFAVTTDADFQNIRNNLRPERPDAWLDTYVNYDRWSPYHAVCEAIRHYDYVPADSHLKNRAWYFEPWEGSPFGRLWTLPHDSDASWGPNWNDGVDYSKNAIFANGGKPAYKQRYRNVIREFRDLVWTQAVIHELINDLAARVIQFSRADRDRWRSGPAGAGSQDFGPIETKIQDMKNFAFVGWSGSTGPTVPAGGRAAYLDSLSSAEGDATSIPGTPAVAYAGPAGFPLDALTFQTSAFNDPQGAGTFAALEWRAGEVTDPALPSYDPAAPKVYEQSAAWTSGELAAFQPTITIPPVLKVGRAYRVRARMKDTTERWSHWSGPVEFTVGSPIEPPAAVGSLRITEIMYNPSGGGDFEFIELLNTGGAVLDLTPVSFTAGIEFAFAGSEVETLAPGEYVVLVENRPAFESIYEGSKLRIAGEYAGSLSNGGELLALSHSSGLAIQEFAYSDEWNVETDGFGYSLETSDLVSPPNSFGDPQKWQVSDQVGGTPGLPPSGAPPAGGLRLKGDGNQDGVLDIADAFWLLRNLFSPSPPASLPCEGGSVDEGANGVLLDVNGDEAVNLADTLYLLNLLFQRGPPPVGGSGCVRIEGCVTSCAR